MFYIVKGNYDSLLSAETYLRLGFLKIIDHDKVNLLQWHDMSLDELLKKYYETFTSIGCLGEEYNILLDDNAIPAVHAPRTVP